MHLGASQPHASPDPGSKPWAVVQVAREKILVYAQSHATGCHRQPVGYSSIFQTNELKIKGRSVILEHQHQGASWQSDINRYFVTALSIHTPYGVYVHVRSHTHTHANTYTHTASEISNYSLALVQHGHGDSSWLNTTIPNRVSQPLQGS